MTVKHHQSIEIQGADIGVARCRLAFDDLTATAANESIAWSALVTAHPTGASSVPANAYIVGAGVNIIEDFSGGSAATAVFDLGDAGNDDELLAAVDCFTGAKAAAQLTVKNGAYTLGTFEATAYVPLIDTTITADTVDNLTAGQAEFWIEYRAMTTDARVLD